MSKGKYKPKYIISVPKEDLNTIAFTKEVEKEIKIFCKEEDCTFREFVAEAVLMALTDRRVQKARG